MFEELNNTIVKWKETQVGTITDVNYNFPHFYGRFVPAPDTDEFRRLFEFLMDEDETRDPPFRSELLEEENWWLQTADGQRLEISIPAIDFADGTIDWRQR